MATKTRSVMEGAKAPDFSLPTDQGGVINLGQFKGKIVILYFYPKDDTAGCTKEAIEFSNSISAFAKIDAVVIGVSKDSVQRHLKFREKHNLTVLLASDETGETIADYGSWVEKTLYGRKYMGIDRSTFLIDKTGKIRRIWRKVRVPGHVEEVLSAASGLSSKH